MLKVYHEKVLKLYENIRTQEEQALLKRREEIEKKLPEVIRLEKEVGKLSLELSLNILRGREDINSYINSQKEKITELRIRKSELLVSRGYSVDYLELHYRCAKCKDTGRIGNVQCSCYKYNLVKILYQNSELNVLLKTNNFDNFSFEYFSTNAGSNEPESPRKNMEKIANDCWNFINNFPNTNENLLFYGDSGTGKSFLANCVAKELFDNGYLVIYRTAVDLIENLKEIRYRDNDELEDLLLNCDLLIIDDLGTEPMTEFSKGELFNLLNRKLLKGKKMIISTNFTLELILKTYSERISSRLLGNFNLYKFYGDDIRVRKNVARRK
ncbi:MAG: DNA replication protein DnaC [Clostridium lundense]|nr:DNA replication protein DnaC [Clostridium lundense]